METKPRHSLEFVEEQKKLILAELKKVEEDRPSGDVIDENEGYNHQGDGIFQKIKSESATLTARQLKRKNDLLIALGKCEIGEYGICVKTRRLIRVERLRAVPEAQFCLDAIKEEESKLNGRTVLVIS